MVTNQKNQESLQPSKFGLIPNDWKVDKIMDYIDLETGFPFPSNQYSKNGIRLLRGNNIKRGETDWSEDLTKYWNKISPDFRKYVLDEGDIVIAMDGSLVGKSFARLSKKDLPALLLQRVARVRSNSINMDYLKEWICSKYFTKHCNSIKTESAIPHISPKDIREFIITIPPTETEQCLISKALSNTDELIKQIDYLITKKKNIKQGTMQDLLSGKRKLSGFDDEWKFTTLGENGVFSKGKGLSKKEMNRYGMWKAIPYTSIFTDYNEVIDNNEINQFTSSKNILMINSPHLLIAGSSNMLENVGKITAYDSNEPVAVGGDIILFKTRLNVSFLSYLLNTKKHRSKIVSLSQGSTIRHVYGSTFEKYEIELPKSNMEQEAITKVLLTMDLEIKKLEKMKSKYISSKNGMMQKLLTGEIRLT